MIHKASRITPIWTVFNQSQSPSFQYLFERLSIRLGDCLLITGSPFEANCNSFKVIKAPSYIRKGFLLRFISWCQFAFFSLLFSLKVRRNKIIIVTTNPPFLIHFAYLINRLFGVNYCLLVWDAYPDHLVSSGLLSKSNFLVKAWNHFNQMSYDRASLIVVIAKQMIKLVNTSNCDLKSKIVVIPNFVDTRRIAPIAKTNNFFAKKHALDQKKVILYSGNMGATHGLDVIVDVAYNIKHRHDIVFVFIGDGLGKPLLLAKANQYDLRNVVFLDKQPEDHLSAMLSSADIAIISQSPGTESLSLPSKTYNAISAGCSLLAITSLDSDLADLVLENRIGKVANRDLKQITNVILQMLDNPSMLESMKSNSRTLATSKFDCRIVEEQWYSALYPFFDNDESRY